ncbi:hypothetical protein [Bradyrhizobium sp. CCGUVB14]|uniref:hypothetical protein n=1 Tax=Bradyrhizobium sp. CCGUVB14 TaxID=2949628 RepID=UPI0020B2A8D3|nr:hypothetical protein [Bradyrhizobium sp. CCGUVB14]MCP3447332.1 hypothetical protein [Bradyrhizobium sp. CCGUVB14]
MSTETPTGDTFLARRFNFLGLPSERRGGALSYTALRTELGDDNAAALVTKIGVLVQVHQLDKLGIPMQNAVDRILQSLTPDERRSMAQGGAVPPRVEAILNSEAETARLQQKQTGPNGAGTNADVKVQHAGVGPFGRVGNMAMAARDGGDSTGASSGTSHSGTTDLASIKPENYASSHFASVGLSYAHFSELRSQGFGEQQIIAAVNTNKQLGLDANSNPAATARLQRDTPWAVESLKGSASSLQQARKHEDQAKDCENRGDMAGAAQHRKRAEEALKTDQERYTKTQERLRKEKPERLDDYMNKHEEIERATRNDLSQVTPKNDRQVDANVRITEAYRRNPEDAKARRDYAELKQTAERDPVAAAAMARVDKKLKQDTELKAHVADKNERKIESNEVKVANNATKIASNAAAAKTGDADLDLLNDTGATSPAKAAESSTKAPAVKTAENKQSDKPAVIQEKKKVAQAKPAAPTV